MSLRILHLSAIFLLYGMLAVSCSKSGKSNSETGTITVTYTESTDDFPNPERGFYRYSETRASNYSPLIQSQLEEWRGLKQADGGNYQVYTTLVFRYFIMDVFKNAPLSQDFLDAVAADFAIARNAGVKLIPRFVYTTDVTSGTCPEGFICPPYGDAPKSIVIQHINQLKPVLASGADVIAVMQLGFIGTWGENYYTDHFGDASQNSQGKLLDNNWQDRKEVIAALLAALPADRMIQVRYPQIKQRFIYGVNASVTVPALLESEAYSGQDKGRIGYHNDCFLASMDDYGTYDDYGNSSTPRQSANTVLRDFWKADSKYVAVGGETCDDTFSPQNDCEPAGRAETEMREMHYSYLNCAYNNNVNNDWQDGGCMDNIRKNLGYRFVLKEFKHPAEVKAGTAFVVNLSMKNTGYAAPFNERAAILVLKSGNNIFRLPILNDIRNSFPGDVLMNSSLQVPDNAPSGVYDMYLWLPDKYPSLQSNSAYSIRCANTDIWDPVTGYNKLNSTIEIK